MKTALTLLLAVTLIAAAPDQKRLRLAPAAGGVTLLSVSDFNNNRLGAFRQPETAVWNSGWGGFGYVDGSGGNGQFYVIAGPYGQYLFKASIPSLSPSTTYTSLTEATVLAGPVDPFAGRIQELWPNYGNQKVAGGVFVAPSDTSKLLMLGWEYYAGGSDAAWTGGTRSTNLSTTTLDQFPSSVSAIGYLPRVSTNNMASIPSAWQASFGGADMMSGIGAAPIITEACQGPCLAVWKSSDMVAAKTAVRSGTAQAGGSGTITLDAGASAVDDFYAGMPIEITGGFTSPQVKMIRSYNGTTKVATIISAWANANPNNTSTFTIWSRVPATQVVYYNSTHPTLGTYQGTCGSTVRWCTTDVTAGYAFLDNGTVAVFGTHAESGYGYGLGGAWIGDTPGSGTKFHRYAPNTVIASGDIDEGTGCPDPAAGCEIGVLRVYDPFDENKGEHAWPYYSWVWLYDARDLAAAYAGSKNPWDVVPYAHGHLTALDGFYPFESKPFMYATGYDRAGKRIFIMHIAASPVPFQKTVITVLGHP